MTHKELLALLHYDKALGWFMWRVDHGKKIRAGAVAGWEGNGYVRIGIGYRIYQAAQLAYFYVAGKWPEHEVDHRDRNPGHNAWRNLRPATHKQNLENRVAQSNNTSGYPGVSWDAARGKWVAYIKHHGRNIRLGRFGEKMKAVAARRAAEKNLFTHAP